MSKFNNILITLMILHSSISYAFCADLHQALNDFDNKNYNAAIPVFEELCNRERNQEACIFLGLAYKNGAGKPVDLKKAIELFSTFPEDFNAQYFLAHLFEYDMGDVDSLNKAYSIYENISKTVDRDSYIEDAFVRLPVYKFLVEFTDNLANFRNRKISYDTFCNLTNNINLSELPSEISSAYLALLPAIQEANMDMVSGFISGINNPFKAVKDVYESFKGVKKRDFDILWDKFISSLDKYKISVNFFINQFAKLK